MATALLDVHSWAPAAPPQRSSSRTAPLPPRLTPKTAPLAPIEVAELAVPLAAPAVRPTRFLLLLFLFLGAVAATLYSHTLRVEGDATQSRIEIRKIKEGNHFLQVKLAQATNLNRIEAEATTNLKMQAVDGGVFMALPDNVKNMADSLIIPGKEPSPPPVMPGI